MCVSPSGKSERSRGRQNVPCPEFAASGADDGLRYQAVSRNRLRLPVFRFTRSRFRNLPDAEPMPSGRCCEVTPMPLFPHKGRDRKKGGCPNRRTASFLHNYFTKTVHTLRCDRNSRLFSVLNLFGSRRRPVRTGGTEVQSAARGDGKLPASQKRCRSESGNLFFVTLPGRPTAAPGRKNDPECRTVQSSESPSP